MSLHPKNTLFTPLKLASLHGVNTLFTVSTLANVQFHVRLRDESHSRLRDKLSSSLMWNEQCKKKNLTKQHYRKMGKESKNSRFTY